MSRLGKERQRRAERNSRKQERKLQKVREVLGKDVKKFVSKVLAPTSNRDRPGLKTLKTSEKVTKYSKEESTLVLGDGDFSFSRGLVQHRGSGELLLVSSYDSQKVVIEKYGQKAQKCINACIEAGAEVRHGVDATRIDTMFEQRRFKRIVFNFPHTGAQRVHLNQALLQGFFRACMIVLAPGGHVHVTVKLQPPYSNWGAIGLAQAAGLVHVDTLSFDPSAFPGYSHRTTLKDAKDLDTSALKHLKTLVFARSAAAAAPASAKCEAPPQRASHRLPDGAAGVADRMASQQGATASIEQPRQTSSSKPKHRPDKRKRKEDPHASKRHSLASAKQSTESPGGIQSQPQVSGTSRKKKRRKVQQSDSQAARKSHEATRSDSVRGVATSLAALARAWAQEEGGPGE